VCVLRTEKLTQAVTIAVPVARCACLLAIRPGFYHALILRPKRRVIVCGRVFTDRMDMDIRYSFLHFHTVCEDPTYECSANNVQYCDALSIKCGSYLGKSHQSTCERWLACSIASGLFVPWVFGSALYLRKCAVAHRGTDPHILLM
jgi:hypothetical protein